MRACVCVVFRTNIKVVFFFEKGERKYISKVINKIKNIKKLKNCVFFCSMVTNTSVLSMSFKYLGALNNPNLSKRRENKYIDLKIQIMNLYFLL